MPAAPLDWGSAPEMNPLETAMWRAEVADPRLRANVALLELLEPAPEWDRLRAARTSGRRGWCRGCASASSSRRSGSARRGG